MMNHENSSKYILIEGSKEDVIEQLIDIYTEIWGDNISIKEEKIEDLLDKIEQSQEMLGDDEQFDVRYTNTVDGKGLICEEPHLYINFRKITLLIFMKLLIKQLDLPLDKVADFLGIPLSMGKTFAFLKESEGELCILLEAAAEGISGVNENFLLKNNPNHECINNHYCCQYNKDGICSCTPDDVKEVLEHLCALGALKQKKKKYYYHPDFTLEF